MWGSSSLWEMGKADADSWWCLWCLEAKILSLKVPAKKWQGCRGGGRTKGPCPPALCTSSSIALVSGDLIRAHSRNLKNALFSFVSKTLIFIFTLIEYEQIGLRWFSNPSTLFVQCRGPRGSFLNTTKTSKIANKKFLNYSVTCGKIELGILGQACSNCVW